LERIVTPHFSSGAATKHPAAMTIAEHASPYVIPAEERMPCPERIKAGFYAPTLQLHNSKPFTRINF
jgi:hypothetical protein